MEVQWEELRKEIRKLESELDIKLVSYSKFGVSYAQSSLMREDSDASGLQPLIESSSEHVSNSMAVEIEQLLKKLSDLNERLGRAVAADPSSSSSLQHIATHHRGKLHDFAQDFRKTRASIKSTREHAELLSSVRRDINSVRSGRTDNLLRERNAIAQADRQADVIISSSYEARETLNENKNSIRDSLARLTAMGGVWAGLNTLMTTIKRRRSRDCFVYTVVVAACICFLIWYWLRS